MTDRHAEDIKSDCRKRGKSLAAVGAAYGITRQVMSLSLVRPHAAAEAAIAEFLDTPAQAIWPSRYNADGTRKRPQPAENYNPAPRFTKNKEAA